MYTYDGKEKKIELENKALIKKVKEQEQLIGEYYARINALENEIERYRAFEDMYYTISNSTTWRMTKPVRVVLDKTKDLLSRNETTRLMYHGLRYLKNNGIKKTVNKTIVTLKDMKKTSVVVENSADDEVYRNGYWSVYQDEEVFEGQPDVKALAFYLPQFHTFPENDKWWGKGFTEWTNTKKARPLFEGHYQPREPHDDIGYYNLTNVEYIKKQAELARKHGIYGFCIYHYWFSGKRLMEKPLDLILEHPEIDINFCLCWANENWTRRWDGQEQDVLIAQDYSQDDPENFIKDLKKYIDDRRYIKVNGIPIILVYNPASIPNVKDVLKKWKEVAKTIGIGEISIWMCTAFGASIEELGLGGVVDREIEFPPHGISGKGTTLYVPNTNGYIFSYEKMVKNILDYWKCNGEESYRYRTVMLGWDNTARRQSGYTVFDSFDLKRYYDWLINIIDEAKNKYDYDERFVFINAWNEWAEGTYLEPDKKYGYANLNTTSRALYNKPFIGNLTIIKNENLQSRIAVQAHMYYEDLALEFIEYMNNIPEIYDCYITTDSMNKALHIFAAIKEKFGGNKLDIKVVDNSGRDVAPFLIQINDVVKKYDYVCHIHTKRSKHSSFGDLWRKYLLDNLLGDRQTVIQIIKMFDVEKEIGLIYPEAFGNIKGMMEWGSNKNLTEELMKRIGVECELPEAKCLEFPAGNMFWIRVDAAKQIFDYKFTREDFPKEEGQLDGTIMHSIERAWNIIVEYNGFYSKVIKKESIS